MRGLVLAAGFGTRLKPITDVLPKALVSVCGVPLVEIALRYMRKNAFEDLAVNMHYQSDLLEMFIDQLPYDVTRFNEQPKILGTGGALFNAKQWLSGDTSFAVLNADIVTNAPLKKLQERFDASDADVVLIASSNSGAPSVSFDDHGKYSGTVGNEFTDHHGSAAFIGLTLYKKETLEFFTPEDFSVVPVWQRLVEAGKKVEVWSLDEIYWQDTGKPNQIAELYWDILDKKIKFDFPLGMEIDFERKIAWSSTLKPSIIDTTSRYLWVEQVLGTKISGDHAILHGGVEIDENRTYRDIIVTPWCEVECAL